MTIKEMEERTGLDRANIRFYEKEGLLSPERLANGYRDYTEADVNTLLRIKLLRSLHVPLDEIRALQRGDKTLAEAMNAHLHTLAQEKQAVTAAEDVCRAMQQDHARFEDLHAEKYLDQLAHGPQTESVGYALPKADTYRPPMHPWRRYFARTLDYNLYLLPLELCSLLVFRVSPDTSLGTALSLVSTFGAFLLMLLIEPILLHLFGTTPGKWLFGLRLTQQHDVKLSLQSARRRTWDILWRGYALGIPILNIIRMWNCYKLCKAGQEQDWDEFPRNRCYVIRDTKPWRGAAYFAAATVLLLVNLWATDISALPPNRGDLTVAEFAENYNYICKYYYGDYPLYVLNEQGEWVDRTEISQLIDGQGGMYTYRFPYAPFDTGGIYISTLSGGPIPLEYETDLNGHILSITMEDRSGDVWDIIHLDDYHLLALAFVRAQPGSGPFTRTTQYLSQRLESLSPDKEFTCAGVHIQTDIEALSGDAFSYSFRMIKKPQT